MSLRQRCGVSGGGFSERREVVDKQLRRRLLRGLSLVALSLAVIVITNLLAGVVREGPIDAPEPNIDPASDSSKPDWPSLIAPQSRQRDSLTLALQVDTERLVARFALSLPKNHPLLQTIQRGKATDDPDFLVRSVIGTISLDGQQLSFERPTVTLDERHPNGQISISSVPEGFRPAGSTEDRSTVVVAGARQKSCCSKMRVVVRSKSVNLVPGDTGPLPVAQASDRVEFVSPSQPGRTVALFYIFGTTPTATESQGSVSTSGNIVSLVKRLDGVTDSNLVVDTILTWSLDALPILLFLFLYRTERIGRSAALRRYAGVVPVLVGFYFGLALVDGLTTLTAWSDWNPATGVVHLLAPHHLWPRSDPGIGGEEALAAVAVFVFWPTAVRRFTRTGHAVAGVRSTRRGVVRWLPAIGLALLACLVVVLDSRITIRRDLGFVSPGELAAWTVAGAAVLLVLVWLLSQQLPTEHRPSLAGVVAAAFLLIDLALTFDAVFLSSLWEPVWGDGIAIVASTVLLVGIGTVLYWAIVGRRLRLNWARWPRWQRLALCALVVTIALPFGLADTGIWAALDMAYRLDYVIDGSLIAVLLLALHRLGSGDANGVARRHARYMGILLVLVGSFGTSSSFLWIPLPFLLGFLLLDRWLLPERDADRVLAAREYIERRNLHHSLLKELLKISRMRRAARLLHKDQLAKMSKGETDYPSYRQAVRGLELSGERRAAATLRGLPFPALCLRLGPSGSSWRNGLQAAKYGLVLSLPWIVLRVRADVLRPSELDAGALSYFWPLIFDVGLLLLWGLEAFFLGYFFPYVRGSNGLWKGFWFAFTLAVPTALLDLLLIPTGSVTWLGLLVWCLQAFITLILVGFLAGDLRTLREAGYGVSELFDIHSVGTVAAWSSSLVLTLIVAALTGALTTSAQELVRSQIESHRTQVHAVPNNEEPGVTRQVRGQASTGP
jgi:hypothetical protein